VPRTSRLMKLRYKVVGTIGLLIIGGLSVLAYMISHDAPCEPAAGRAADSGAMLAVVYHCYGSADVLELARIDKPVPADNEILVRVRAAAVNPLDWHYMRGSPYLMRLSSGLGKPDNTRIGVDFAGVVEATGSDVDDFAPGDRVFGGATGAFAEYVVIPADRAVAAIPDGVSFEQAAAVPIAATTALQALRDHGRIERGESVLINGASGGVGTFAVQIATAMGAEVSGVCSTRNVEMVRAIGADHVFDYKKQDYTEEPGRYDVIVDLVGNHSISKNRRVLNPGGRLVLVGGPKGDWIAPLLGPLSAMIQSPFVEAELVTMLAKLTAEDLRQLATLMAGGAVTPQLDRSYPLDEIAEAIRYSESGRARGKIIITVP